MHKGQRGLLVEKEQRGSQEETASQELMDNQAHKYIFAFLSASVCLSVVFLFDQ